MDDLKKILVVDDEPSVREVLSEGLDLSGYECFTASNYSEALEKLKSDRFQLVLSDINMPGESGIDLLRTIKEHDHDMDVIMVTGVIDIDSAIHAMRLGASDYVTKPFNFEELRIVIERTLEKRRLIQENREYQLNLEKKVRERTEEILSKTKEIERLYNELSVAFHQIQENYNATLEALIVALDTRDAETQGHSKRVVEYTSLIAERIGIVGKNMVDIRRGALLHDVGKIGIPDAILRKPGKLTDEEWCIMRKHPEYGYKVLSGIKFLEDALLIVLHHHERWDGTGYPGGLKNGSIPLAARIFAVADTLDAMTSPRPYRNALTYEQARDEVLKFKGTQFDPMVADVFLSIPKSDWEAIDRRIHEEISIVQSFVPVKFK
ncbi:MAG: HD domain-containing phosphohydrolase [Acidobacteriota bacterium]